MLRVMLLLISIFILCFSLPAAAEDSAENPALDVHSEVTQDDSRAEKTDKKMAKSEDEEESQECDH